MIKLLNTKSNHSLFFLHGLSGITFGPRFLAKRIDGKCSLYGIENIDLFCGNSMNFYQIEQLADMYLDGMDISYFNEPVSIFGNCISCYFAYELFLKMNSRGLPTAGLFLINPPVTNKIAQNEDIGLSEIFHPTCGKKISIVWGEICNLTYRESIDLIVSKFNSNLNPHENNTIPNDLKVTLPTLKAHVNNLIAYANYRLHGLVDRIHILVSEDSSFDRKLIKKRWSPFVSQQICMHELSGNTNNVYFQPTIDDIQFIIEKEILQ